MRAAGAVLRLLALSALAGCRDAPPPGEAPARLVLDVYDLEKDRRTAARFSILADGRPYFPDEIGEHGLRFFSVHEAKNERLRVERSTWLAARGLGVPIRAIAYVKDASKPWTNADVVAHSAAVRVEVGGAPVRSAGDAARLADALRRGHEHYRTAGRYAEEAHRAEALRLFDRALEELGSR